MSSPLACRIYFDSRRQASPLEPSAPAPAPAAPAATEVESAPAATPGQVALAAVPAAAAPPPAALPVAVDVATDPAAAEQLLRLGVSSERDLPALALAEPGGKVRLLGLRLTPEEIARLAGGRGLPAGRLVVYSSSWCPDCRNAKRVLHDADASFEEVDIDQDPDAEALVLERSGGRRVVPTLRFNDRLWAFNPAPPLLRRLLGGGA